jgi:hypothetical protein
MSEFAPVQVSSTLILPAGSIISVNKDAVNVVKVTYRNYQGVLMSVKTNYTLLEIKTEWLNAVK